MNKLSGNSSGLIQFWRMEHRLQNDEVVDTGKYVLYVHCQEVWDKATA